MKVGLSLYLWRLSVLQALLRLSSRRARNARYPDGMREARYLRQYQCSRRACSARYYRVYIESVHIG